MTETAITDWLQVGAAVAEVNADSRNPSVERTTITKIGKRDVVLANGRRYNANRLVRDEGGTWGPRYHLRPADHPDVARVSREVRVRNLRGDARAKALRLENLLRDSIDPLGVKAAAESARTAAGRLADALGESATNGEKP